MIRRVKRFSFYQLPKTPCQIKIREIGRKKYLLYAVFLRVLSAFGAHRYAALSNTGARILFLYLPGGFSMSIIICSALVYASLIMAVIFRRQKLSVLGILYRLCGVPQIFPSQNRRRPRKTTQKPLLLSVYQRFWLLFCKFLLL
jgi:hypothetical protein